MNYYRRHLGDYARKAGHLTMLEHGAYTLILDAYYDREQPLTRREAIRVARARSEDEIAAVDTVLEEFFTPENPVGSESVPVGSDSDALVHVQHRVEQEIEEAQARAERAKANGGRGGRPRKSRRVKGEKGKNPAGSESVSDGLATETQKKANPLIHESNTNTPCSPPKKFDEFKAKYPKRAGSQPWPKAEKAIQTRLREGHTWEEILSGVERYTAFCQATDKIGTETVMQAATFCGPDKRFLEPFDLPKPEKANGKASNRDRPKSATQRSREGAERYLRQQGYVE